MIHRPLASAFGPHFGRNGGSAMPKLHDLTAVDVDYATDGPNNFVIVVSIDVPAAVLFNCLTDGPAWKEWLGIDVEWTSPEPFGIGTTRTVSTAGQTIEETFLAWDQDERLNFRFDRATLPVSAFAEDYRVVPVGDQSCSLHWSYAYEWAGPLAPVSGPVFAKLFAMNGKRSLSKLKALLEANPGRFA